MSVEPSATAEPPERIRELLRTIRSDDLPRFAQTLQQMMPYVENLRMFQIDLILDANVVMSEVLWLARKREKPGARSGLLELIDCKVVRAYAPHFLKREMKANIPEVAAKHGLDPAVLASHWRIYRAKITFVAVGGPPRRGNWRDPKDVPYLRLQRKLECLIVSDDADLQAMGGKVVRVQIFGPLRAYSRAAAVEYQMKATGALSVAIAASMAQGLFSAIKRVPTPVLWGGAILSLIAVAHPTSRKKIFAVAEALLEGGSIALPAIAGAVKPFMDAHTTAHDDASSHLRDAKAKLVV